MEEHNRYKLEAIEMFERLELVDHDIYYPSAIFAIGLMYNMRCEYAAAVEWLQKAVNTGEHISPDHPWTRYYRETLADATAQLHHGTAHD